MRKFYLEKKTNKFFSQKIRVGDNLVKKCSYKRESYIWIFKIRNYNLSSLFIIKERN